MLTYTHIYTYIDTHADGHGNARQRTVQPVEGGGPPYGLLRGGLLEQLLVPCQGSVFQLIDMGLLFTINGVKYSHVYYRHRVECPICKCFKKHIYPVIYAYTHVYTYKFLLPV